MSDSDAIRPTRNVIPVVRTPPISGRLRDGPGKRREPEPEPEPLAHDRDERDPPHVDEMA
jgi:hypothetical protein